jgi:hypothetical protein
MTYREKKNAERANPKAVYHRHKAYKNARAYRDARNRGEK